MTQKRPRSYREIYDSLESTNRREEIAALVWLFANSFGRTLDILGIENDFIRVLLSFPLAAVFFYGLISLLYAIQRLFPA